MITPLAWLGRTTLGPLLGSKVFWEIILTLVLILMAWRYTVHQQELGATREQAKQQAVQMAAQAAQAAITQKALSDRLEAAKAAQASSAAETRRYQEAMNHDKATQDWRAMCGVRPLPLSIKEYIGSDTAVGQK